MTKLFSSQPAEPVRSHGRLARLLLLGLLLLGAFGAQAQVSVTATAGTTAPTTYTTLAAAFAAINAGTHQGAITVGISASTTETATAVLNASGSGTGTATSAYTSVLVRPTAASVVVTSALSAPTVSLNGAANVTLDGRPNGTAAASPYTTHLTIQNTGTNVASTALTFTGDANANAVRYCQLQGGAAAVQSGVVVFAAATTTTGNSNNTLQYNSIGPAGTDTPYTGIYSAAGSPAANAGNVVDSNNIYDFFNAGNATAGVFLLTGNNSGWTISNNYFYQSATRTYTTSKSHACINVGGSSSGALGGGAAGSGYTIVGNHIGGTTATALNAPVPTSPMAVYTLTGTVSTRFAGISIQTTANATATVSAVKGNTVENISLTTADASTGNYGMLAGIYVAAGVVDVGGTGTVMAGGVTVSQGNTIGSATTPNSISVSSSGNGGQTFGISGGATSTGALNIVGNTVAGISAAGTGGAAANMTGIGINISNGPVAITGNTLGTAAAALSAAGSPAGSAQVVRGIACVVTGAINTITGNTVTNLVNNSTVATTGTQSIGIITSAGTNTIGGTAAGAGNTVYGFGNATGNAGTGTGAAVIGIAQTNTGSATFSILGNTVYDIGNTGSGASVVGVLFACNTSTTYSSVVSRNLIYNLTNGSPTAGSLYGIQLTAGLATISNNMVRLGTDANGSNGQPTIGGIYKSSSANNAATYFLHNSVYIGGTATAASGSANSFAFGRLNDNADVLVNNVLVNVRAAGTGNTGQHVPVQLNSATSLTVSNNVYYTTNTLTTPAAQATVGGTPTATITGDANSVLADPRFIAPAAATPNLHIMPTGATPVEGTGIATVTVGTASVATTTTDDFDGETRSNLTPVDIGADAGNFGGTPTGPPVDVAATALVAPAASGCYGAAQAITVSFTNAATAALDLTTTPVTVTVVVTPPTGAAQTFTSTVNTGTLAAGATQNVTLPGTLNLNAGGSYSFAITVAATGDVNQANNQLTVTRTVTAPTASFPAATATSCGSSPYQLAGTVGGAATAGTYTSSGTGTFTPNATTLSATYTPSAADITAGSVTITLTSTAASTGCTTATATLTLSFRSAPVATFSYPTATTYCAGSTSTVTPTLGTGAAAGTFSSTTGLTINATTGVITLSTATAGTYTVTNTIAASGSCPAATATTTVTIAPATSAVFSYAATAYCTSGTSPVPTITGTAGGTFSSTTGLSLNASTGAITLASSTAGTYTVTYTVAGACGSSSTKTVTITAAPVATFSYATAAGCAGGTGTAAPILGTGAAAGTFSSTTGLTINATTGVITLSTATAGTYTVTNTIAASGGCAAATATATFTVNPTPATPTLTTSGTPATGITLTSSATTGNQFYRNGVLITGATNQTYLINSGTQNGSYTVVVTGAGGCASAPSAAVAVTVTATAPTAAGKALTVYPNPTPTGQLTLELTGYRLATQLTVLDALGRVVISQLLPANSNTATHSLDLTGVVQGVYLLRLSNADGVDTRRLLRE